VYAISGRTRAVIYDFVSPEVQDGAQFGFFIAVLGDVDGDGKNDLAAGTDSQDTTKAGASCTNPPSPLPADPNCNKDQGKAWVLSGGKSGEVLYAVSNPDPQANARFGSRIGRAGDINGDDVSESIMGASNHDLPAGCGNASPVPTGCRVNQGQAYIFDGKDGHPIRTLTVPASDQVPASCKSSCGTFGLAVQGPGDVDGDGVTDQLVAASSLGLTNGGEVCDATADGCNRVQGAMYLFSGDEDGKLLARIDDPVPQADVNFGFQDAAPLAPGDVNGDGRADLFANGFTQAGEDGLEDEGRIWVFDGKATVDNPAAHGVVLYEPKDPTPSEGGQCCFSLDRTDYNKDGTPDLYVGQSPHHLQKPGIDQSGGTYVFDGRDGSLLKKLELPPGTAQRGSGLIVEIGSALGWSVAAPGDLDGDGEPDFLAGSPFQDGVNPEEGKAFVFLSGGAPVTPTPTPTSTATSTPALTVTPTPTPTETPTPSPGKRLKVRLKVRVKPERDRKLPYRYKAIGSVRLPHGTSKKKRRRLCKAGGRVSIQTKRGRKTISTRRSKLRRSCKAKVRLRFAVPRRLGKQRPYRLKMTGRFTGNQRLKRAKAKPVRVKAG